MDLKDRDKTDLENENLPALIRFIEIEKQRFRGKNMAVGDIPKNFTETVHIDLFLENLIKSFQKKIEEGENIENILWLIDDLISAVEIDLEDPILLDEKETNNYYLAKLNQIKVTFSHSNFKPIRKVEKQFPKFVEKTILFSNNEIIETLHFLLKGYFENYENDLLEVLKGKQIERLLLFPSNQNKFVEVFKRAKYNGFILSTPTEIKDWICSNFTYIKTKGESKTVEKFNVNSVWDILTKDKGEPKSSERICVCDILPYKSYSQRKRNI